MEVLFFSLFLLLLSTHPNRASAINDTTTCPQISSCSSFGPKIRFPFRLNTSPDRCGFPGLTLSCKHGQTILNLPFSGEFSVQFIDYVYQSIGIDDPDGCLPRRTLNFNLAGTPFQGVDSQRYTYYNCTSRPDDYLYYMPMFCLSGDNFTVISTSSGMLEPPETSCRRIKTVSAPVHWSWDVGTAYLLLKWNEPNCRNCETAGGLCGYLGDTMEITCFNSPKRGLPRGAKYGVIIGVGIPGLVFLIGLACCTFNRIKTINRRNHPNLEPANVEINPRPFFIINGLDKPTIESFPKIILGESGRLPKPNEGTCPICISEYEPKETLRTIPECNHYFHAKCIDEWLKLNGTCPLCRNTPYAASLPSSSPSS
ncbi:putative RING-H2 finger protein ATL21B [Impatiens glandulifera]|uniref:putative RING-H2 finger protein ATL21B n=1 Tax=Impatiens glandulifera TaxID=253017 RepID=UPI001FB0EE81|nr:putative RING-H2 finger protein ATL21B [Impatiens glandulifera]